MSGTPDKDLVSGQRSFIPSVKYVLAIIIVIIVAALAVKNLETVQINYYDYRLGAQSIRLPLVFVVAGSALSGLTLAWLLGLPRRIKLRAQLRRQDKAIKALQEEIDRLKSPVTPLAERPRDGNEPLPS